MTRRIGAFMLFLFLFLLSIASPSHAFISPATRLLDQLTNDYEQSPTDVKRSAILKFVVTGNSGEHLGEHGRPYKRLSKRIANAEERKIMFRALIIANRSATVRDAEDEIAGLLNTVQASPTKEGDRHKLISFMVVHLAFGKVSHFLLDQIIRNFRSQYSKRIRLSCDLDEEEIDSMFKSMDESPSFENAYADVFKKDLATLRIQSVYRGHAVREKGRKEYDKVMDELEAMVAEAQRKREMNLKGWR